MSTTPVTQAELAVRIVRLQRAHNALAAELSATAASIRAQLAADYNELDAQQITDEALLTSILTEITLTTTRTNQPVLFANQGTIDVRVAILCITTNVGTTITIPAHGAAEWTDANAGDTLRLVSVDPFTATLG